jgi:uncharacterized cupin superfamily protein
MAAIAVRTSGFVDPLTVALEVVGPKVGATSGEPIESALVLSGDGRTEVGVWECTPGMWPSAKVGVGELMSFVAGHGWIVDEVDGRDGERHEIRAGLIRWFPDGWRGRWEVDETVRKTYVIVRSDASDGAAR